jgi:hypothetical protein
MLALSPLATLMIAGSMGRSEEGSVDPVGSTISEYDPVTRSS